MNEQDTERIARRVVAQAWRELAASAAFLQERLPNDNSPSEAAVCAIIGMTAHDAADRLKAAPAIERSCTTCGNGTVLTLPGSECLDCGRRRAGTTAPASEGACARFVCDRDDDGVPHVCQRPATCGVKVCVDCGKRRDEHAPQPHAGEDPHAPTTREDLCEAGDDATCEGCAESSATRRTDDDVALCEECYAECRDSAPTTREVSYSGHKGANDEFWMVAEMRNALGDAEVMLSALASMLAADMTGDAEHGLARLNSRELARRIDVCRDVLSRLPQAEEVGNAASATPAQPDALDGPDMGRVRALVRASWTDRMDVEPTQESVNSWLHSGCYWTGDWAAHWYRDIAQREREARVAERETLQQEWHAKGWADCEDHNRNLSYDQGLEPLNVKMLRERAERAEALVNEARGERDHERAAWAICDEERRLMLERAERVERERDEARRLKDEAEVALGESGALVAKLQRDYRHLRNELALVKGERDQAWKDRDEARAKIATLQPLGLCVPA